MDKVSVIGPDTSPDQARTATNDDIGRAETILSRGGIQDWLLYK